VDDPNVDGPATTVRVREGQVFYNNRFELKEIIGRHASYRVKYLDVENHTFTVKSVRPDAPDLPGIF